MVEIWLDQYLRSQRSYILTTNIVRSVFVTSYFDISGMLDRLRDHSLTV